MQPEQFLLWPQNYDRQKYRILALFAILVDVVNKMRRNSTIIDIKNPKLLLCSDVQFEFW